MSFRKFSQNEDTQLVTLVNLSGSETGTEAVPLDISEVLNPDSFTEYAHQHTGVSSPLAVATTGSGAEYQVQVVSDAAFTIGKHVQISDGTIEPTFAKIMAKPGGNILVFDRRLDKAHPATLTIIEEVTFELAVIGTIAVPQEFIIRPEGTELAHIQRVNFSMVHGTAGDMGLFGNLPPLINGVTIRVRNDGVYKTLTNWKTNDEMKDDMFDVLFDFRASGGGSYGTSGRWTFERYGAEVRLDAATNDQLEVYVQDDLTGLDHFSVKAQGHYKR